MAFIIYMIILALSVPLPIPSSAVIFAGGYIFGTVHGTIISLISVIVGATISFFIAKKAGVPLLKKITDPHHLKHWEKIINKRGPIFGFIAYAIPIFPSDLVSLAMGLTRIKYKVFITMVFLGHIPRILIVNSIANNLFTGLTLKIVLLLLVVTIFILIGVFRYKLRGLFFKELKFVKKEINIFEKEIGIKS